MPSFVFTAPDGKSYTVNGPEGSTAEQAFQILQQQIGPQPVAEAPRPMPAVDPMGNIIGSSDVVPQPGLPGLAQPAQSQAAPSTPKVLNAEDYLAAVAKRKEESPDRSVSDVVIDAGITLLKGTIGLPESLVGLADIVSGGYAGKLLQDNGFKPKEAKAILDTYLSEAQQVANRKLKEAKGFGETIATGLQNPSVIATAAGESLPQMIGGAGVARGVLKAAPSLAPWAAGAIGEGVLGAGSAAEQLRQDSKDGLLNLKQTLAAVGSGVGTAAFGAAGGRLAAKLGLGDIDTMLAAGTAKGFGAKSVGDFAKKAAASGVSEGVFEEMPQSAQEQMWMNYANDKPLTEGVPEAMAMGLLTGAAMGIAGAGAGQLAGRRPEPEKTAEDLARERGFLQPITRRETTQAGLPGLVTPPEVSQVTPAAPKTLEQEVQTLLKVAEEKPEEEQSQDINAMLQELFTAKGEAPAVTPATPVTPTTGAPSGTQAPQAVEAEAQGQEAAPPGELSLDQRYDAVIQSYRDAGMDENARQVELGRKYNLTPQGVANSEEIADRAIRQNRLIKGAEAGTNEPIEPTPRTISDLYETKYETASSDFVPKEVTKLVLDKLNGYINQLAQKGIRYEEVDSRFPKELVAIKNAESALRGQFLRYANQLKAVEKDYKRASTTQFEQAEAELGQMLGVDLKAMREAKAEAAKPKTEGQIAVGSRVEWQDKSGAKSFGTVARLVPASEQNKLPAIAWVQSDAMSNAQTPVPLDILRPTTQPKVTKQETGPTAKERREKQQDERRNVGRKLDEAIDKAKGVGDTKTVEKLTNLRAKFDRKDAGPRLVKKEVDKANQAMAGKAAAPTVKPSGAPISDEEMAKLKQEMQDDLAKLADILGKGTRLNIVPEQEQKLIPVLTSLMDKAFRMGYLKFKEAAKYVLGVIRSSLGKQAADQVTLDHLQGAYIGMAGKYQDQGASSKKEVVSVETLDELEEVIEEPAEETLFSLSNPEQQFEVAQEIADHFLDGNKFAGINEARTFISDNFGIEIRPGTPAAKQADEAIEAGVVIAAREIVAEGRENGQSSAEIYDRLVELYGAQPNLAVRTSTSVSNQAYSTPVPLAFVASELAGINDKTTVYEPTAGNGMLVIGGKESNLTLNELNADRYQMLQRLYPDAEVTQGNALQVSTQGKDFDVVIENPPFGKVDDISNIDHDIALHSLRVLSNKGRAVLILGGVQSNTEEGRREGYRGKAKREFYYELYNKYNVVDHFTAGGNMYAKQGTTYPVDVIVIDGLGKSKRDLPAADLPQLITSYEQLKEKLNEARVVSGESERPSGADLGGRAPGQAGGEGVAAGARGPGGGAGTEGRRPAGGVEAGVSEAGTAVSGQPGTTGGRAGEVQPGTTNVPESVTGKGPVARPGEATTGRGKGRTEGVGPGPLGGVSVVAGERVESGLTNRAGQETETAGQVTYNPKSMANSVGTLVPRAMADSIEQSLARVEAAEGNLDEYVARSLEMDPDTVRDLFSAEQVDALALAIRNAEEGKGFIIGDQTGVGKGRVVAAMIRYALVHDKIPIFVTEKPNLYSDMIRDLDDIGMTNELGLDTAKPKILITNSDEKIPYTLLRTVNGEITENNLILKAPRTGAAMEGVLKKMQQDDSLGDYKVIFTTYSQMQTVKGKMTERMRFISQFGAGNYMIFDESHNAGGAGEQQARTKEQREKAKEGESLVTGRAAFVRSLVNKAFGTFFSSATYAKRPDVMDLYSSTDMKLAVDRISDLADAIKQGGIPMQQAVAKMLTQVGQYIRRERTFAGVSYDTQETKVDKTTAENMATSMRDILAFSRMKEVVVKGIQKELDKEGARAGEAGEKTKVQSANFGSIMHNLIDQMLLSLKAQDSVRHAIERLKAGEKVVMTVSNTMGSFLKTYADDMNLSLGDKVDLSFADLYLRYLEKQRIIKIKRPGGAVEEYRLTDEDLGPQAVAEYNRIQDFINNAGFGSAPISPIDYMHAELRKAGYKTEEITGRTITLSYETGTPVLTRRTSDIRQRVNAVKAFNGGTADVIILNQAGSTGLSLHASSKVKDQRKRHMIIVQPEKNIDTHMQMLGRVHRTGQVIPPAYSQMMADIPAEMRPAAVLLKKMASLNANTTASRKSAVTAEGAVDFMNDYGGQVVMEYLRDNPEVYDAIGGSSVVQLAEDPTEATEDDIRKLTGYIPILPIKQQEEIYKDLIDRYNDLIQREDSMGTNKLEAKAADLDAKTISSQQITEDKGDPSVFAQPAFMEQVDVKRTVKPYSKDDVQEMVKANSDTYKADPKYKISEVDARAKEFLSKQLDDIKAGAKDYSKADPVRMAAMENQLQSQLTHVKAILYNYPIGTPVSIKNANGVFLYGTVINIESKGKTKNPVAGSDWKMTLALANGDAKSITLNFSQIGTSYTLANEETIQYLNPETLENERIPLIDLFDRGATVRREKRWMVTGNILAGYAAIGNAGQIMTYTKEDGTTGQGILMSRTFDFEKQQKNAPVKLSSVEKVNAFFNQFGIASEVSTENGVLKIKNMGYEKYRFTVPSSKRDGGSYYLDSDLTRITGDFYKSGPTMSATVYGNDLNKALQYIMSQREESFIAVSNKEEARKAFQVPLKNVVPDAEMQSQNSDEALIADREANIAKYREMRQRRASIMSKFEEGKAGLSEQSEMQRLKTSIREMKREIDATKPERRSAKNFFTDATKAWDRGDISDDVYAVIETLYKKFPFVLEGLRFSVTQTKDSTVSGQFFALARLVRLYKGTNGVSDPSTARHEIVHSLEQMMSAEATFDVVQDWTAKLEKAINTDKSPKAQAFFKAVLAFMEDPSEQTYDAAIAALPSYEYYQYINPSEYWAVNAEKLMARKLGTGWDRFVLSVKKLYEGLKYLIGFDNQYVIHRTFDDIMNARAGRVTKNVLVDYVGHVGITLANINTRRNYKGGPAPLSSWTSVNESNLDNFFYRIQDKHIDTKRVQEAITNEIGDIEDRFDAYMKEELYHGRVAKQTADFLKNDLQPLIKDMAKRGVKLEDFEEYLQNRTAPDRNALIASRNPMMPDGGSGIFNEEARDYMNSLDPETKKTYEALAKEVDKIVRETQDILVDNGLEKPETIAGWRETQPLYVPLNRDPDELDFVTSSTGLGQGFSTRGRFTKTATGSLKTVVDILGNIALQREKAIIKSEKARVGRALYGLAISSPNPDFWMPVNPAAIKSKKKLTQELINLGLRPDEAENIIQEPRVPRFDNVTGEISYQINPSLRGSENVFAVRINGEDRFVFFNPGDPRAIRMIQALKNLDGDQLSRVLGIVAEVTRTYAALNTQYNPVFGAWNFVRDTTAGAINLSGTPLEKRRLEVFAGSFPALRAIYRDLREKGSTTPEMKKWIDLFERFQNAGGQTGYREQFSRSKQKATVVQRELANLDAGNARKAAKAVFDWLSDYNDAMENAVRLSAFKAALDEGLSEERAASLAKNLTVNFNRKGQSGTLVGSLYAFFNASMQGTARMGKLLVDRTPDGRYKLSKHGKRIIAGGVAIGVFQAVVLAMAGFGEDEPPEFLKNKNLIIPVAGGNYLIIPMPMGLNVFPNVGRTLTEFAMSNRKDVAKLTRQMFSLVIDTFNPLGSSGVAQTIAPTVIDPIVAVAENKDAFGRPIYKADRATNPTPGYERNRETSTALSQGLSYAINYMTGGGEYGISKIWSPTADELDYLAAQYTGGVGREIMKAARFVGSMGKDEEIPPYKVPILGKLYGETTTPSAVTDKFYKNVIALAEHEGTIKRMREKKADTQGYKQEYPETRYINRVNRIENEISKINRTIKEISQKPESDFNKDRIKRLKEQKIRMMTKLNQDVATAQE